MKALVFRNETECKSALALCDTAFFAYHSDEGYTVDERGLVGKNGRTGKNAPNGVRTERWDKAKQRESDGAWWFWGLDGKPYKTRVMNAMSGFTFAEQMPDATWYPSEVA